MKCMIVPKHLVYHHLHITLLKSLQKILEIIGLDSESLATKMNIKHVQDFKKEVNFDVNKVLQLMENLRMWLKF